MKDIVAGCGYSNARSGGGVTSSGPVYAETVPPLDMLATRTWASPGGAEITFADLKAAVLGASSHGGGWLQLQGHVVCSQEFLPSDYDDCLGYFGHMELSTLNAFLDWMQRTGQPGGAPAGVTMETVRQVVGPAPSTDVTPPVTTMTCNGASCASHELPHRRHRGSPRDGRRVGRRADAVHDRRLESRDERHRPALHRAVLRLRRHHGPVPLARPGDERRDRPTARWILLDRTAPVTTIACNSAACSGWYRAAVTVTLTATDTGGSGIGSTHYTTDGSAPSLTSPTYTGPFQITQTRTVRYASWDVAGNKETTKVQAITIDGAAPNVAVTAPANGATVRRGVARTVSASATRRGNGHRGTLRASCASRGSWTGAARP